MISQVFLNGVVLHPQDYIVVNSTVVLSNPTQAGDMVDIRADDGSSFMFMPGHCQNKFDIPKPIISSDFIRRLEKHGTNPTIKDQLDRLEELLILVEQE